MTVTITVRANGPLLISPEDAERLQLIGTQGQQLEKAEKGKQLKLCRCGASENKPYCDASHVRVGFVGTESPQPTLEPPTHPRTTGAQDSAAN